MSSFKEYSFQDHGEVYKLIDAVFRSFDFQYYLIGAAARDFHLYKAGSRPKRGTADIDFAVMIPDIASYEALISRLIERGFEPTMLRHRLIFPSTNSVVDILPYGEIAEDYIVDFDQINLELCVLGFYEVGNEVEMFEHSDQFSLPVSSLHDLVILKLISWNQRKDRNKDLQDIKSLLDVAWELYENELFVENSKHFDLFDADPFDMQVAAARIVGRKIRLILEKCEPLKTEILAIMEKEITNPEQMVVEMSDTDTTDKIINILNSLWKGITD